MTTAAVTMPPEISENRPSLWTKFRKAHGITYVVLSLVGIIWVFPFFWMVLGSLKTQRDIMAVPPTLLPKNPTLGNFTQWFTQLHFGNYFINSLVVALVTMLGNLVFCSMVGYALAKIDFAGKNVLFLLVMVTLMVPSVATFIPLFVIISNLHMLNTYFALILPFLTQPIGAGELRIFFQIVLPQCKPPLATLAVLTFLSSWNNFLWPLVAAQSNKMYTLPVALSLYSTGQNATNYSVLLAGAVLVVTPILLLFIFLQKYFIQGVTMSGIK